MISIEQSKGVNTVFRSRQRFDLSQKESLALAEVSIHPMNPRKNEQTYFPVLALKQNQTSRTQIGKQDENLLAQYLEKREPQ